MADPLVVPLAPLLPTAPQVVGPPAHDPVAADLAADIAGKPRPGEPTPPPPGTVEAGFWQRSATKTAITVTIGLLMIFAHAYILQQSISREAVSTAFDGVIFAWLAAIGIHNAGSDSLRWK